MKLCSISNCKKKHYALGLCKFHYQKTDKYKQYHKQYQKTDKYKQYLKQKAISDLAIEVNKYDWIKDKNAMILNGKLADRRMKELRNPKEV